MKNTYRTFFNSIPGHEALPALRYRMPFHSIRRRGTQPALRVLAIITVLISTLLLTGCAKTASGIRDATSFKMNFTNLPTLENGYYQLSFYSGNQEYPIKKFGINDGKIVEKNNKKEIKKVRTDKRIYEMDRVEVRVEGDTQSRTEKSVILTGDIVSNKDTVTLKFNAMNLENISGQYMLATLTDENPDNERSGIWFGKKEEAALKPALNLPPTQIGWMYEAWIEYKGKPISLGRFGQPYGKDMRNDFSYNNFSYNKGEIVFPGEDFLRNLPDIFEVDKPVDLANGEVKTYISLEPDVNGEDPADKDTPFALIILSADIVKDTPVQTPTDMTKTTDFPSGEFIILD